jgi:triosephosphate isomerase
MRKMIVAGNWKMNTDINEARNLALGLKEELANYNGDKEIIVAPPYTNMSEVGSIIKDSPIRLSSQNCASETSGAYTGEVSVNMIKSVGAEAVIIGHSERRAYFKESDEILLKKLKLTLETGMQPIFCFGEVLEERESGKHEATVKAQLTETVFKLSDTEFEKVILAYEPVWAIGTGKVATPDQAQDMHAYIRDLIVSNFNEEIAENTTILYGGSCKPNNASQLFSQKDVDGGLIGGASLKVDDFVAIINA